MSPAYGTHARTGVVSKGRRRAGSNRGWMQIANTCKIKQKINDNVKQTKKKKNKVMIIAV